MRPSTTTCLIVVLGLVNLDPAGAFRIPLFFGELNMDKREDGKVDISLSNDISFGGSGFGRDTKLTVGNGTFVVNDSANIAVNGTKGGGASSQFGWSEDGLAADGAVRVGEKKVESGLSNPFGMFQGFADMFKKSRR